MNASKLHWIAYALLAALAGSALHFVFDLLSGFAPVGIIAAVNESVWEHMKLAFWPMLVFGAFASRHYSFREWVFPLAMSITVGLFGDPAGILLYTGCLWG